MELSEYGTVNTIETLDDGTARVAGAIRSGVDAFDYTGAIRSFTAGEDIQFVRDGTAITRDEVVDEDSDTDGATNKSLAVVRGIADATSFVGVSSAFPVSVSRPPSDWRSGSH